MDRRKHKIKYDEFDILETQIKKNKTKENKEQSNAGNNILPPVIKSKNTKKINPQESSSDDSDLSFTSDSFDDSDITFSTDTTDTDEERKRKNKAKEKRSKEKRSHKNKDKVKDKKIKNKGESKKKESRKNKHKTSTKIVNQNVSSNRVGKYHKNTSLLNNNSVFVDPSKVFTDPFSVLSQSVQNDIDPVKNNLNNMSDYQVHENQKINIEKSMNIISSSNTFDVYEIKLPINNINGNYVELLNLSNITPTYKLESNNKILSSDSFENNIYIISNPSKNIKFLFHNDEWMIIR